MSAALPNGFGRSEVAPDWEAAPADLAAALAEAARAGETIKTERETLLYRAPLAGGGHAWWKLYRVPGARRLLSTFSRSRGLREWRALNALAAAGLDTAQPLAFGEARRGGLLAASLVVTREVPGGRSLRDYLADPTLAEPERHAWLAAAGRCVRRMHEAGFGHFRLQLRNLVAQESDGERRLFLLDAPFACAFPGPAPERVRRVDLVDLAGPLSGLDTEQSRTLLYAYAGAQEPVLDLRTLRGRPRWPQKLRRIALYLYYTHTGHRPAAPAC